MNITEIVSIVLGSTVFASGFQFWLSRRLQRATALKTESERDGVIVRSAHELVDEIKALMEIYKAKYQEECEVSKSLREKLEDCENNRTKN